MGELEELGELGARIRVLRTERGLTLTELAEASSVSVSMLSAVERRQKSPTITVLARIARGLGTPLAQFVTGQEGQRLVVRRASRQDVLNEPGGWRRVILSPVVPGVNFELVRTTLPAGADPGEFPGYASGSHEYVVVEEGRLHMRVGDAAVDLGVGDSLYFAADVSHQYSNPGNEPCSYYVAALITRPRRPGARLRG
jgi:XRE family transcriptional regulator, regulator of sulfur utilization